MHWLDFRVITEDSPATESELSLEQPNQKQLFTWHGGTGAISLF